MKGKTPLSHEVVCFQMLDFGTSNSKSEVLKSNSRKNYVTSEGAASNNVLYYQPVPITRYQARFYANHFFLVITYSVHCLLLICFTLKSQNKNHLKRPLNNCQYFLVWKWNVCIITMYSVCV